MNHITQGTSTTNIVVPPMIFPPALSLPVVCLGLLWDGYNAIPLAFNLGEGLNAVSLKGLTTL